MPLPWHLYLLPAASPTLAFLPTYVWAFIWGKVQGNKLSVEEGYAGEFFFTCSNFVFLELMPESAASPVQAEKT